jgi:hypothetical protein
MTDTLISKLQAFAAQKPAEACELCALPLAAEHDHLLEPSARRVLCACRACAALFAAGATRQGVRYLRVERHAQRLRDIELDDALWTELGVPVGLAYFSKREKTDEIVATFPGRAGTIESPVARAAWDKLEQRHPALAGLLPELEALLVRRTPRHRDYFRLSVDHCYELSALLQRTDAPLASPEQGVVDGFFAGLESGTPRGDRGLTG